ncbi:hypothetical protein Desaci_4398 [Desulfosporosinus acidiphilus SJ4]|uniref:Gas vesicle protein n=1 Tax=Desulfosporosinus acidiphilus (strain DSM 22704 / JCM 16185 / SJ4) TaxID=646529 RepID=I4DBR8_DESAJ|nr:YtxH domain-containing protein [Desulfosporosinus acidiphilus]AFM43242.1 hypothetical protein Desaci_4398 [Desulfosporosinus acidiphilus SJ4]
MANQKSGLNRTTVGTIVLAALVGGFAGVLAGLLFAPQRGKDLRHSLRNNLKNRNQDSENLSQARRPGYITLNYPKVTN